MLFAGRGAIMLTVGSFNLVLWIFGALFTLFGLVSSLKGATERIALRVIRHRKARRRERDARRLQALTAARA